MARFFKSCGLCCSNVLLPNKHCAESKAESLSANWALVPLNPQICVAMHTADALCTTWQYQKLKTWRSVEVEANWNHLLDSEISPVSDYFPGKTCNQSNFHEEPSIWAPALYKASWVGSYPLGGIFAEAQSVNIRSPAELKQWKQVRTNPRLWRLACFDPSSWAVQSCAFTCIKAFHYIISNHLTPCRARKHPNMKNIILKCKVDMSKYHIWDRSARWNAMAHWRQWGEASPYRTSASVPLLLVAAAAFSVQPDSKVILPWTSLSGIPAVWVDFDSSPT